MTENTYDNSEQRKGHNKTTHASIVLIGSTTACHAVSTSSNLVGRSNMRVYANWQANRLPPYPVWVRIPLPAPNIDDLAELD